MVLAYIVISLIVSLIGRSTYFGFSNMLILCLTATPITGILVIVFSHLMMKDKIKQAKKLAK